MKGEYCISCEIERKMPGRRYCNKCYLDKRKKTYENRRKTGWKKSRYGKANCIACGTEIIKGRLDQQRCATCNNIMLSAHGNCTNTYVYDSEGRGVHRNLAERIMGCKLHTNEVVHHIDGDGKHNSLSNLLIMSRAKHGALHAYLREIRATIEKDQKDSYWGTVIESLTITWLETANVKFVRLSEII